VGYITNADDCPNVASYPRHWPLRRSRSAQQTFRHLSTHYRHSPSKDTLRAIEPPRITPSTGPSYATASATPPPSTALVIPALPPLTLPPQTLGAPPIPRGYTRTGESLATGERALAPFLAHTSAF